VYDDIIESIRRLRETWKDVVDLYEYNRRQKANSTSQKTSIRCKQRL
jgi:hypothetical protein